MWAKLLAALRALLNPTPSFSTAQATLIEAGLLAVAKAAQKAPVLTPYLELLSAFDAEDRIRPAFLDDGIDAVYDYAAHAILIDPRRFSTTDWDARRVGRLLLHEAFHVKWRLDGQPPDVETEHRALNAPGGVMEAYLKYIY